MRAKHIRQCHEFRQVKAFVTKANKTCLALRHHSRNAHCPFNTICQSSSCLLSIFIPKSANHSSSTSEASQVPDMFYSPGRSNSALDSRQGNSCHDAGTE